MRAKKLLTSRQIFRYAVPARTITKKALAAIAEQLIVMSVMLSCSADAEPAVNGEHAAAAAESSQDADDSHAAADDSQLSAANDTSACDVTGDTVTVHVM